MHAHYLTLVVFIYVNKKFFNARKLSRCKNKLHCESGNFGISNNSFISMSIKKIIEDKLDNLIVVMGNEFLRNNFKGLCWARNWKVLKLVL